MRSPDPAGLAGVLREARHLVFLGGAGVSTASGIPDYRSASGLYSQDHGAFYPGDRILSADFFSRHPGIFFSYYHGRLVHPDAKPNGAHRALARLEARGILRLLITQNIDGLHQKAGSRRVYEMHGSMERNSCVDCRHPLSLAAVLAQEGPVPRCPVCRGIVRPDVVLYGEPLDKGPLQEAIREIRRADTMLVGGTKLAVNPARGLVKYFRGQHLVFLNREETDLDHRATMILRDPIEEVLPAALARWQPE